MAPSAIQEQAAPIVSDLKAAMTKPATTTTTTLEEALSAAQARFEEKNQISKKLHELATQSLPGGNTRTLLHTAPFPLVMKLGKGVYVWSEDGHK